ncbi:MAG: DUF4391 domain-containing protein [Akkermansia sp.]|nr:DUF4391 domain-containing protein [Akkermansia sp.]
MYGLPPACEVKKQLPKKAIYAKFNLNAAQRDCFDEDIARLDIVGCVSTSTIPAIAQGELIQEFYVLKIQLKHRDYDSRNIALLTKLIQQKMVFALHYEEEAQLAIFHTKLISSGWQAAQNVSLPISGLNLDSAWDNIVKSIGQIKVDNDKTLDEQIAANDKRDKILARIASLEKKMDSTKQTRRKRELFQQIKTLKNQIP